MKGRHDGFAQHVQRSEDHQRLAFHALTGADALSAVDATPEGLTSEEAW